jgi:RimJ/RimL family protein N-acetyltransferase
MQIGPVRTMRLRLRPLSDVDLDAVHALHNDAELIRYLPWEPRTREQSADWLRQRMASSRLEQDDDALAWAVERLEDGRLLGSVNAWWRSVEHAQGEIGFVLARDVQRQGYAREAVTALVDLLFRELDLRRVYGTTDGRNTASAGLMSSLGMRQEAHLRECERFKGEWSDVLIYAVLRTEWLSGRAPAR